MMRKKVICFIQAFDCEKTIEATMRSVLEQTYPYWYCFVLSNGNRNALEAPNYSFDVIKNFAARDKRFVVLNKKYNSIDMYIPSLYHLAGMFPDDYICSLDADDIYENDFFERAVIFAEKEGLDIVACGTQIVLKKNEEAVEERLIGKREMEDDLIVRGEDFARKFIRYRSYFNEMWGKLYRASLFSDERYDWKYAKKHFFGRFLPDTLFTFDNLSRCRALGILAGTSHKFYQFEQRKLSNATLAANAFAANHQRKGRSALGQFIPSTNKFNVHDTYGMIMSFLRSHGRMDKETYEYMQAILFGWYGDYYARTLLPTSGEKALAEHTRRLVMHPKFDRLMRFRDSGKYDNLKGYKARKEFCVLLRNTLAYQPVIHNREKSGKINLACTPQTQYVLKQTIHKIDATIKVVESLQKEEKSC